METKLKNYRDIVIKAVELYNINIERITTLHFYIDKKNISLYYLDNNNFKIKKDVLRKKDINYKYDDFEYLALFKVYSYIEEFFDFDRLYKEVEEFLHELNKNTFSVNYIQYITFYNDRIYLKFYEISILENMGYTKKEYLTVFKKEAHYYIFKDYPHLRIIADNYIEV